MTDYSKFSDEQLAIALMKPFGAKEVDQGIYLGNQERYDFYSKKSSFYFDPCNNIKQGFPIVEANGITLIKLVDGKWLAVTQFKDKKQTRYHAIDEKPLRAAVIAYLSSKEEV